MSCQCEYEELTRCTAPHGSDSVDQRAGEDPSPDIQTQRMGLWRNRCTGRLYLLQTRILGVEYRLPLPLCPVRVIIGTGGEDDGEDDLQV